MRRELLWMTRLVYRQKYTCEERAAVLVPPSGAPRQIRLHTAAVPSADHGSSVMPRAATCSTRGAAITPACGRRARAGLRAYLRALVVESELARVIAFVRGAAALNGCVIV
eukprot:6208113-Pleurochrysis_carterae.AAC.2